MVAVEAQAMGLKCLLSDQISQETSFTKDCEYLDVEDKDAWVNKIIEVSNNCMTVDAMPEIIERGYDIKQASHMLENFYIDCNNRILR